MKLGVTFPQTEIGPDPAGVRAYAEAAEELGYSHLLVYDHVLGADPAAREGWRGAYTFQSAFHEPFVLFGFLAAVTRRLELVTGVLILPQRQTALVAKQAAEVDVLTGGRLRLGIGVGWNAVEYEALGEDFHDRGRRSAEQIAVLRALWTAGAPSFTGRWHQITAAGINPMPVQRPIPIWIGGSADAVLRRIARLGDGWFPLRNPDDECRAMVEQLRAYTREAGRDPDAIGIEGRINMARGDEASWVAALESWQGVGATHMTVNTMGAGYATPQQHIDAIRRFKSAVGGGA